MYLDNAQYAGAGYPQHSRHILEAPSVNNYRMSRGRGQNDPVEQVQAQDESGFCLGLLLRCTVLVSAQTQSLCRSDTVPLLQGLPRFSTHKRGTRR